MPWVIYIDYLVPTTAPSQNGSGNSNSNGNNTPQTP